MKLKLESVRDISVLHVSGAITLENFAILRAGIKKLFSTGKNKIILELPDSASFPTPVLREIAILNFLAAELSGQIILAEIAALTRAKIEAFSKPPVVKCFSNRNLATEFFYPKVPDEIPSAAPVANRSTPATNLTPSPTLPTASTPVAAPTEEQQKAYKQEIRAKELGDLGEVRKKLSELEVENKELKTRMAELMLVRREPPDIESWREKVSKLEKDLADAIKVAQDAAAAKK